MPDIHDKATRSRNMRAIRGKDTKPELLVRRSLFAQGFRYRLHVKTLPGKPDLVLRKYNAVVFVHGCFWHKHGCKDFKLPKERRDFWSDKLGKNVSRDNAANACLDEQGWRVAYVWECSLKGGRAEPTVATLTQWLLSGDAHLLIE